MSLILEALKKSEAERRVGQPPGLLSQAYTSAPERRLLWPWLAIGLLPLAIAAAWWFGRASIALPDPPVESAELVPAPPPPAPVRSSQVESTALPSEAPRPAMSARAPPPALRQLPPPSSETAGAEREAAAVSAAEGEALLRGAPLAQPAASISATASAEIATDAQPPSASAYPAAVTSDSTAQDEAPELRDLDPTLRAELPPLRVSMHVFDADPQRRFVLIDGRRLSEGDGLGEGLLLIEIRREGSLLEFRGHRFLLPRPG